MIPRGTPEELRTFVMNYCNGQIFTSTDVNQADKIGLVFMVLTIMDVPDDDVRDIGFVWEYLSEAGPRSINGMPMFHSARFMHREDAAIVAPMIVKETKRRETFIKGSSK